jgi:hypothetical protein
MPVIRILRLSRLFAHIDRTVLDFWRFPVVERRIELAEK